jgi:RNA polymerase sigma-70 factor, ECF subfamily
MPDNCEITHLLNEATQGNSEAESLLMELMYEELHRLAVSRMRHERPDHTLQPTALVNEAFLCLFARPYRTWTNRTHFFAFAARVMRSILIDHARRRASLKQGGGIRKLAFDDLPSHEGPPDADLIALDTALKRLSRWDPRQVRIVELRFFAGLTEEEISEVMNIGTRTVKREWAFAKAWLQKELSNRT